MFVTIVTLRPCSVNEIQTLYFDYTHKVSMITFTYDIFIDILAILQFYKLDIIKP